MFAIEGSSKSVGGSKNTQWRHSMVDFAAFSYANKNDILDNPAISSCTKTSCVVLVPVLLPTPPHTWLTHKLIAQHLTLTKPSLPSILSS